MREDEDTKKEGKWASAFIVGFCFGILVGATLADVLLFS